MEEEILIKILEELKAIRGLLEEQNRRSEINMQKIKEVQEVQKEKVKEALKTMNPAVADILGNIL